MKNLENLVADARARTFDLVRDLSDEEFRVPLLRTINPFLWEIGHVAYFQEYWVLRHDDLRDLYDSAIVPHDSRWHLPLPSRADTIAYLQRVRDQVIEKVRCGDFDPYFILLSVFHEDMHDEAFLITRQTLGYALPPGLRRTDAPPVASGTSGDISIPAGTYTIGSAKDEGFIFDNEKWAHALDIPGFRIARALVTQNEFREFIEDTDSPPPGYWKRDASGEWLRRHFDRWIPLEPHRPVSNISWHQAEAFCRWAGRRLPTEFEWEVAAKHGGCEQMFGSVWQWTSNDFLPYAGFSEDPYKEYSSPWFRTHKTLRGAAWSTRTRMMRPAYRNFYTPDRCDLWAGIRTCAMDS